jgi:hypothetical protein
MPEVRLVYGADKLSFRGSYQAECGTSSGVVGRAWLNIIPTWGSVSVKVTCLDGRGGSTAPQWSKNIANNILDGIEVPSGTRAVTVEGTADNPDAVVTVRLIEKAA